MLPEIEIFWQNSRFSNVQIFGKPEINSCAACAFHGNSESTQKLELKFQQELMVKKAGSRFWNCQILVNDRKTLNKFRYFNILWSGGNKLGMWIKRGLKILLEDDPKCRTKYNTKKKNML
jgi:hypothetical protein